MSHVEFFMLPEVVDGHVDLDWFTPREAWARYAISEATQKRYREKTSMGGGTFAIASAITSATNARSRV